MTESGKYRVRLDDELKNEVDGLLRGGHTGGRADESRESEPGPVPAPDPLARSDADLTLTPDEIEARSRLGRYLPRTVFPAGRAEILQAARGERAPDDVLDELSQLPDDEQYENVAAVWLALGHEPDRRF